MPQVPRLHLHPREQLGIRGERHMTKERLRKCGHNMWLRALMCGRWMLCTRCGSCGCALRCVMGGALSVEFWGHALAARSG